MANMPYCQQNILALIMSLLLILKIPLAPSTSTWDILLHAAKESLTRSPFSGTPSPYSVFSTKQIQNLTSSTPTKKSVAKCCQHLQRTRKCPIYQVSFASSPVYLPSPWGGLSSPKEAFRTAEAAVLEASALKTP